MLLPLCHPFHQLLPPSTCHCPSLHWSHFSRWRPFRRSECLPQRAPELPLCSLLPLQIRVCCEQTPQGGILVLRWDRLEQHENEAVAPVAKTTVIRHFQLHTAPLTLCEVVWQDDDHFATRFDALDDVLADLSTDGPVSLVQTQPITTFCLESRQ